LFIILYSLFFTLFFLVFLNLYRVFDCFVILDLIISDLLTHEPWDHQVTETELTNFIKQADAANASSVYTVLFWHKPFDTHIIHNVFSARHIQAMQHIYWVKPNQYGHLPVGMYTNAVEMASLGHHPDQKACRSAHSKDPRARMNFFTEPSLTKLYKASDGKPINPCQKPVALLKQIISNHCPPGGNVLVIGSGAGAEVEGALEAKCNVVGVEYDQRQFDAFTAQIVKNAETVWQEAERQRKALLKKSTQADSPASTVSAANSPVNNSDSGTGVVAGAVICPECEGEIDVESIEVENVCAQCKSGRSIACKLYERT